MTSKERNTLFQIQHDIVEHSVDSRLNLYKTTFDGVEFESKARSKVKGTDDLLLQVIKHISDEVKKKQVKKDYEKNVEELCEKCPIKISNTDTSPFSQYNFFERCKILLGQIKSFDQLAHE